MRVRTSGGGGPPRDDDRVPAELATPDPTTARESGRYRFGTKRSSGGPDAVLLVSALRRTIRPAGHLLFRPWLAPSPPKLLPLTAAARRVIGRQQNKGGSLHAL